ncbi:Hypothetical protein SMAX5B_019441 [Scophthalmus maximus]|uniref:Uncharacterized protein n=1 Tax=Scophthalmus maximus TaxID=52904 RepID=A0A2U9CSR7_SCOMX|nr:Hypothetical protein SMAX5B_019441 [Scophthalmus maximus]
MPNTGMAVLWLGDVSERLAQPQVLEHVNVSPPPLLLPSCPLTPPHDGIAAHVCHVTKILPGTGIGLEDAQEAAVCFPLVKA